MSCVCRLRWIMKGGLACMRRRLASHPPRRQAAESHACVMRTQIAVDVARGLAYMHAKKAGAIIHRDLKPGNLMVSGSMYHARCVPSHPINRTQSTLLPLCTTRTGASPHCNPTQCENLWLHVSISVRAWALSWNWVMKALGGQLCTCPQQKSKQAHIGGLGMTAGLG